MKKEELEKFLELQDKEEKYKKKNFYKKLYKFCVILGYFWIFLIICIQFKFLNDFTDLIIYLINWIGNIILLGIWKIIVICSSLTILYTAVHLFFKIKKLIK